MELVDGIRRALQPMMDKGQVHSVLPGPFASYQGGLTPTHQPVTVLVNADDPEAHRVDITKLVLQAGLKVELNLRSNPAA